MDLRTFITLLCGLGAVLSLYWGLGFLLFFRERNTSSQLLGGLLLVMGIRMIKSALFIFSGGVPLALINIGFAAHYCIGPALFLYLLSLSPGFQWNRLQWLHFLPGLVILPLITHLTLDGFWYRGGSNYQMRLNPSIYALLLYAAVVYFMNIYLIQNRSKIIVPALRYKRVDVKQ